MASSDSESDGDVGVAAKGDLSAVGSLLGSVSVLTETMCKKLNADLKSSSFTRLNEDAEFVKEFRLMNSSVNHLLHVAGKKVRRLGRKIERLESQIEDKDEEIEKIEETHAFVLNDLEQSCKVHKEDKKLLLPLSFKTVPYSMSMSTEVGGDTKCSTCLQDYVENVQIAELSCGHFFHRDCAMKWMTENKSVCSLCKTHVMGKSLAALCGKRRRTITSATSATSAHPHIAPSASSVAPIGSTGGSAAFEFDEA